MATAAGPSTLAWWRNLWRRPRPERLEQRLEASFRVLDGQGGTGITSDQPVKVLNLSDDGCCLGLSSLELPGFHLERCLDAPQEFPLELAIQAPRGGTWRLHAQVRWADRQPPDQPWTYRVGTKFLGAQSLPQNWRRLLAPPEPSAGA